jgi:hypothetical protein
MRAILLEIRNEEVEAMVASELLDLIALKARLGINCFIRASADRQGRVVDRSIAESFVASRGISRMGPGRIWRSMDFCRG